MEFLGNYKVLSSFGVLTSVLCFALGALVYRANPASKACKLACAFNLSVATWSLFYAVMYFTENDPFGLFVSRMLTTGTIFLSTFITHLVLVLAHKEKRHKALLTIDYLWAGTMILIMFSSRLVITGVHPILDFPAYTKIGPLYFLVTIHLFFNLVYSLLLLYRALNQAKGYRKHQLLLFGIATLIGYSVGTPALFLCYEIPIKPFTTPFVVIYPVILTYTIMKHRFLDIQKLVQNTVRFSLLFAVLLSIVAGALFILQQLMGELTGMSENVTQAIMIALVLAFYGPLKYHLSLFTNKLFFQHKQDPQVIFRKLSEDILHYLDTKELASEVTNRISEILMLNRIGFYIRAKRNPTMFELAACRGRPKKKIIHQSRQLVNYLERTKDYLVNKHTQRQIRTLQKEKTFFALSNLKDINKYATLELGNLGGVAAFPVFIKKRLHAIIVTGRKMSDAAWNDEEFRILMSFMRHLTLALGNSLHAEQAKVSRQKLSKSERNAMAGALISGVDHEVMNPLQAMMMQLGGLESYLKRPDTTHQPIEKIKSKIAGSMENVCKRVDDVNRIINQLSDGASKKPLKIREAVTPSHIAVRVIQDLRSNDTLNGTLVKVEIPTNLQITADSDALSEILTNLIRNAKQAIKESGVVTMRGFRLAHETVIEVHDTGIGMSEELQEKIFDPFFTTKRSGDHNSGTGLGLFVAKEYMQAMGGSITVRSHLNKGTVFNLHFPTLAPELREVA